MKAAASEGEKVEERSRKVSGAATAGGENKASQPEVRDTREREVMFANSDEIALPDHPAQVMLLLAL